MHDLKNGYYIKKMDPKCVEDMWLIEQWNQDKELKENLWPLLSSTLFYHIGYLYKKELHGAPYSIWYHNHPIGHLNISNI